MKMPSMKLLTCVVTLACASFSVPASADHTWGSYHWARTSNPFTLKLGDNVSSAWDAYLATTSADWSVSSVLNTTIVAGGTTGRRCKPTAGRVEVCNEKYGKNGWLGLAQIWASGSHITQGTTKVNDTYFNTPTYNTTAWRNLVMCQEVGHALGLDQQDENFSNPNLGTCMDYTSDPTSNQHPNDHDYEQLEIIYDPAHVADGGHLDSTITVGQAAASAAGMPRAMAENDYAERSQWGKLIRSSKNGLKEVYLLEFGQGYKIFTFVTWAEGHGRGR